MPLWQSGSKAAKDLIEGDVVIGVDEHGRRAPQKIAAVHHQTAECLEISLPRGVLRCSLTHPVVGKGNAIVQVSAFDPNKDELVGLDLQPVKASAVRNIGERPVVAIECEPNHVFFAGGVLNHNKTMQAYSTTPIPVL